MKFITIFKKNILETIRAFGEVAIVLVLPIVFMAIFGFVFGDTFSDSEIKMDIFLTPQYIEESHYIDIFKSTLKEITYEQDNEKKQMFVYEIKDFEKNFENSKDLVKSHDLDGILLISSPTEIEAIGDVSGSKFNTLTSVLENSLQQTKPILSITAVTSEDLTTPFDFIAPGLIIYGMLIMIPQITTQIVREIETKRLARLIPTQMSSFDLFSGVFLFEIIFGFIQLTLLFGTAKILGYDTSGSMILGFAIGILTLFFVIGIGLLISAFSKTEQTANSTGVMISVILGFLSGSFLQLPRVEIGTFFGQVRQVWEILPSYHATQALQQVLTYGKGVEDIWQNLVYIFVSGIVFFVIGLILFAKKQLQAE